MHTLNTMTSMRRKVRTVSVWAAGALLLAGIILIHPTWSRGQDAPASPIVVLNAYSNWRIHQTVKPPVVMVDGQIKPFSGPWTMWEKYTPASDWMTPDFDDRGWVRTMIRMTAYNPKLSQLCLRGKFGVANPAKVSGLKLTLSYHGGAIVYVNGKELTRAHVAKGSDLADAYPPEAFVGEDGKLSRRVGIWAARRINRKDTQRLMRRRALKDIDIPSKLLRRGVNVIAIEILRAPYSQAVAEHTLKPNDRRFRWPTCMLYEAKLTATGAEGLTPNAVRPEGLQVWNQNLLTSDFVVEWGDRTEKLRPVEITGVRNGAFSGKLMVGSTKPIQGINVAVANLKGAGDVIPASQVRVRYALPWGDNYNYRSRTGRNYTNEELGCLSEKAPVEIPLSKSKTSGSPVDGAVTAVWVTVNVPRNVKPGAYSGALTIGATGEKSITVPLQLKVLDWMLPDPQNYKTWMEIMQSPDTLAIHYETPLWSKRHWELIAQSFRLMSDSGSRVVYVPLIAETNQGNSESMVRWIKKGENRYDYDFSVMDKYLELAEKNLGPLKIVVFPAWEAYMMQKESFQGRGYHKTFMEKKDRFSTSTGPVVTVLDKATGKTENVILPRFGEDGTREMWKPLFDQLRLRLAKRKLDKKMMVGVMNDGCPSTGDIAFFAEVAPDMPWVVAAHGVYTKAKFGYRAVVYSKTAEEKSLLGWKRPDLFAHFNRNNGLGRFEPSTWRTLPGFAIVGVWRGVGRLGGDFWKVLKNKKGRIVGRVYERYPQSNWRNLDIYTALLAPMPTGIAITTRYEHLREGLQECEARIVLERAVSDEALKAKLGPELAARCETALMEHMRAIQMSRGYTGERRLHCLSGNADMEAFWFVSSGWEERAENLFTLAGQVERKMDGSVKP